MSARFIIFLLVMATALGCARERPKTAAVSGRITFDGDPLPGAAVLFMPQAGGRPASGITDDDGMYRLTTFVAHDGALLGNHTVLITKQETIVLASSAESAGTPPVGMPVARSIIPERYGNADFSQLAADVVGHENHFDFDLSLGGR